jgi:hypothetical protein|tara:strand:- start:267 stop:626 length:360 start_codon:yes stop_codon:yes gene_type:complete
MFKHKPNKGEHMLENVESNQSTTDETPVIDTSHELKWKRTYRKRLINCLALIENHGRPTTELLYEQRKAKEALNNWNSDSATFVKHQMVFPLSQPVPQTELQKPEVPPIDIEFDNNTGN